VQTQRLRPAATVHWYLCCHCCSSRFTAAVAAAHLPQHSDSANCSVRQLSDLAVCSAAQHHYLAGGSRSTVTVTGSSSYCHWQILSLTVTKTYFRAPPRQASTGCILSTRQRMPYQLDRFNILPCLLPSPSESSSGCQGYCHLACCAEISMTLHFVLLHFDMYECQPWKLYSRRMGLGHTAMTAG
jgi:hypothetical protein